MLVSYSVYFSVNLCSQKVSIRFLDTTVCCINSIQPQELQLKFPGEKLTVVIRKNFDQHLEASFWLIHLLVPLLQLLRKIYSGILLSYTQKLTPLTAHCTLNNSVIKFFSFKTQCKYKLQTLCSKLLYIVLLNWGICHIAYWLSNPYIVAGIMSLISLYPKFLYLIELSFVSDIQHALKV